VLAQRGCWPLTASNCTMDSRMMWGMGLLGLLVIFVLLLAAADLVKYLFFSKSR
jgi:hypothetical protein